MKVLFLFLLFLSSPAFANIESNLGNIFLGGLTFSKENYLPTSIQFERTNQELQLKLLPQKPFEKCIKEFGTGVFEYSYKVSFSRDTLVRYKIPVFKQCSETGSMIYKVEIVYCGDTNEIKSVSLAPYRNKSYPYFSTEF